MNLRNRFCIERKSPEDLYQTITKGHPRFRKELIRAKVNGIKLVMYVESTRVKFVNKEFPGGAMRKFPSTGLDRMMKTIETKYDLEVIWCSSRAVMKRKILERLKTEEKNLKLKSI
jgi:ERCC4-type nuclease